MSTGPASVFLGIVRSSLRSRKLVACQRARQGVWRRSCSTRFCADGPIARDAGVCPNGFGRGCVPR
eukprot:9377573-Lingulodinium_polyedra.AAC.1